MAAIFVKYLAYLTSQTGAAAISVSLRSPCGNSRQTEIQHRPLDLVMPSAIPHDGFKTPARTIFKLHIHTPQFYRHIITYTSLADFLSYALLSADEENRTAWSDNPEGLVEEIRKLEELDNKSQSTPKQHKNGGPSSLALEMIWAVYRALCFHEGPLRGVYPSPGLPKLRFLAGTSSSARMDNSKPGVIGTDEGMGRLFVDGYVRNHCAVGVQLRYMLASVGLRWRARVMQVVGGE